MTEREYVNVGNLSRLRTAMKMMQECVFMDEQEQRKSDAILHEIVGLEFHTTHKIKIKERKTA